MTRNLIMLGIVVALATWAQRPHEGAPPPVAYAAAPANDREAWAMEFLAALGNSTPSAGTVAMVVEWTLAEDSGSGAFDRNNPLNTTQPGFAETMTINSDGVKGYQTRQAGLDAAIHTVTNGLYNDVVAALLANDGEAAKQALWASPWAGSHYGYGASWPRYQAPDAAPASLACPVDPCWQSGTGYGVGHPGIDLGATIGQPVYAVISGTAQTSTTWPCGNGVMVTDGATQALVCHLSAFSVADGQPVAAGAQIGEAGSSGQSSGPHVHFEVRLNGSNIDPMGGL